MKSIKTLLSIFVWIFILENAFSFTGELKVKTYSGSINSKYNISMVLYTYTLGTYNRLVGYYYYNSNKQPIFIDGLKEADKFTISEFLDNGKLNATFEGHEQDGKISGKWKMGAKTLDFTIKESNDLKIPLHMNPGNFSSGLYNLKSESTDGSIKVANAKFNLDLVSLPEAHIGTLEGKWQVHITGIAYYFVNEDSKTLDVNCLLCFITFPNKVYVYQVGKPEYFDFGAGVSAQGVYTLKK